MANPIYLALDRTNPATAQALLSQVQDFIGGVKIGLEFWCANGPVVTKDLVAGKDWFLDLKLHDIPNTVAGALRAVVPLGPKFITIHEAGGSQMMQTAAEEVTARAAEVGIERPKLLAVTTLTSLPSTLEKVLAQAYNALQNGIDGAVCSPHEVAMLRSELGLGFLLMVPGIRTDDQKHDQLRVATPQQAMRDGADYLVVGRAITLASDPGKAAKDILASLHSSD